MVSVQKVSALEEVDSVDSLLTDSSIKWTPRVDPCLSLLPLLYSFYFVFFFLFCIFSLSSVFNMSRWLGRLCKHFPRLRH